MFEKFYEICRSGVDLNIIISAPVHGKLAVSVMPTPVKEQNKKGDDTELNIKPLVVSGTPEELNSGFIAEFEKAGRSAVGLVSNLNQFKEMVARENDAQKKAQKKKVKTGKAITNTQTTTAKKEPTQPQLF